MFSYLTDPIENRIISELRQLASRHPIFRRIVEYIKDSFPHNEAGQEGIYIEDTSASHFPLSSQNFLCNLYSHVFAAQVIDTPESEAEFDYTAQPYPTSGFIEWVKEDPTYYVKIRRDDLSDQVGGGTDLFQALEKNLISSPINANPATVSDVKLWVNGIPREVVEIYPDTGLFRTSWVEPNSEVIFQYVHQRSPEEPGLYYIQIQTENILSIRRMGIQKNLLLIESYSGEDSADLQNTAILPGTVQIFASNGTYKLKENVHYTVDYDTGVVTFTGKLNIPVRRSIYASYHFDGGQRDNIPFQSNAATNKLIPGAIVALSDRYERGSVGVVGLLPKRALIADVFGGRWDITVSLMVYARDPDTRQQLIDWLGTTCISYLKERFDRDGLTFSDLNLGGKTRMPYQEGSEDYFAQSISVTLQTDWESYRSYPLRIDSLTVGPEHISDVILPSTNPPVLPITTKEVNTIFRVRERYG